MEATLDDSTRETHEYRLRLFVTGSTPRSARAIRNIMHLCEEYLHGHYELEIIDIYQEPEMARDRHVIAAPTLVREAPLPVRKVIGDCSDLAKIRSHFDIGT